MCNGFLRAIKGAFTFQHLYQLGRFYILENQLSGRRVDKCGGSYFQRRLKVGNYTSTIFTELCVRILDLIYFAVVDEANANAVFKTGDCLVRCFLEQWKLFYNNWCPWFCGKSPVFLCDMLARLYERR